MEFRHGSLVIDIPEDWGDHSTLLFTAPAESLPTGKDAVQALSINFLLDSTNPKDLLRMQAEQLKGSAVELEVLDEGPFESRLGEAWFQIQRLTMNESPVRQLVVAAAIGPVRIMIIGVANDESFDSCKDLLWKAVGSLRTAP